MSGTYDGSIRINTQIDTSGAKRGFAEITKFAQLSVNEQRSLAQSLSGVYRKQGLNQSEAQKKAWDDLKKNRVAVEDLEQAYKDMTQQVNKYGTANKKSGNTAKSAVDKVSASLKQLGSYLMTYLSITAILNFSNEASKMASTTEASVQRLVDIYGEASHAVGDFIDSGARALGMSKSAAASYAAVYGNLFSVWADQATNADLTNHYLNMTAVVASKTGREVSDVQERIRSGLLGNTEAIEDLGIFVNVKTIEMTDAFKRMADGKSWEQLDAYSQQQIRTMAILEQATEKYGTEVAETTTLTRMRFQAAYEDFQTTWGQVVNKIMIPLLEIGTMVLNVLTKGLQTIAKLSGKTVDTTVSQSNAISSAVDNQNALTDAVKETAKAQKGALAGFDEINTLSQETADSSSSGTGGGMLDLGLEDFSGDSDGDSSAIVSEIDSTLATIMGVVGGALVAIGVLLLLSGKIGWGIGFIIAGAATMGVTMAAVGGSDLDPSEKLSTIIGIVSGLILALGIILLIKGPKVIAPLAMGMIVAGAGVLAISAIQIVADKLGGDIGATLHGIIAIVSGALVAIAVIMLCSGQISPLSIGLLVTGAVGLSTEVTVNFDEVKTALQGWLGGVLAIISGALLVIGIIMLCCGIITPLSIGLVVAGAVGLVSTIALNWDAITDAVTGFFQENAGLIVGVSLALLILGIILLITGVGIPIGLGLILAGVGGLAATVALNWDFIVEKIKQVWDKCKQFWNKHIAPIFTKEWWLNLAKNIGNGFIAGIEGMINGVISMFEKMINWIVKGLNKISFDVPDWVPGIGGKTFGFNLSTVDFGKVSIPRLATGMVIPPNQEFLAVLGDQKRGTNIEAPLDTIKQAVAEVIAQVNMNNNNGSKMTITIPVYLNGREILRAERESENEMGKQTVFGGFANAY